MMDRKQLIFFLIIALFFVSACSKKTSDFKRQGAGNAGFPHPVERVVDGDTIIVLIDGKSERVRLIGIDTPESVRPDYPVEYCGREASQFAKELLRGKSVRLEYDVERRDRYGRLLAYVYTAGEGGQIFINAELLKAGLATALDIPPNTKFARRFYKFQRTASEKGRGMWGEDDC